MKISHSLRILAKCELGIYIFKPPTINLCDLARNLDGRRFSMVMLHENTTDEIMARHRAHGNSHLHLLRCFVRNRHLSTTLSLL